MGSSRLSVIRKLLEEEEIPQEISSFITSRWTASTNKNYGSIWERWLEFARDKGSDPVYPTLSVVLQFLMKRYKENRSAAAVNHAISALASVFNISKGEGFLQNVVVSSFRKSANTWKPTGPALTKIWNISKIFNWLRTLEGIEDCSWQDLLERTVLLVRIDLFARSSDLTKLFRDQIEWGEQEFRIRLLRPKEWKIGRAHV